VEIKTGPGQIARRFRHGGRGIAKIIIALMNIFANRSMDDEERKAIGEFACDVIRAPFSLSLVPVRVRPRNAAEE
jgi:hypothetical protein